MTRQRRLYVIAGAAAVAMLVLWYFLLWSPRGNELSKQTKRASDAEAQTAQLQTQLQRLRASQQNEAAKLAQLEKLKSAIPDQPNLAQFILDTNNAATQAGVTFLSITPTPPTNPSAPAAGAATPGQPAAGSSGTAAASRPAEIKLSLSITGGYFQILDFMNRLDQLSRLVVIDTVNVAPGPAKGGGLQLSVQLGGRMFVSSSAVVTPGQSTTTTAPPSTATTVAGGATTTTAPGGATATTRAGASTTTTVTR